MTAMTREKRSLPLSVYVLGVLTLVGVALGVYRLAVGLSPTTNLSDYYPWGLWIGLDIFLIPAAGAAFTVSAVSHFFGREDYHRILRPAVLTGLLGYLTVVALLILDLGRWHQFYSILVPPYINLHSFLEEVALSVTLYTMVLVLEAAPTLLEKWNLDMPIRFIERGILVIAGVGILISTVHQSSLGSMFLILEHRLHPLWWTPILPLLFLTQALFGGLATAAVVVKLTQERMGRRVNRELLATMGRLIRVLLAFYLVCRVGDWLLAGELGLLFTSGIFSMLAWGELILGVAVPLAILLSKLGNRADGVFWSGVWIVLGLLIHRLSTSFIALETPAWATYVPHWIEVLSSVGIAAGAVLVYIILARVFNLFPEYEHSH
ncbi:MAG: polysulfide reductase NrfD [Anaerolineae bacterium]|jgi:Ni/Fe-hydrogenase subunit HybB-like protein